MTDEEERDELAEGEPQQPPRQRKYTSVSSLIDASFGPGAISQPQPYLEQYAMAQQSSMQVPLAPSPTPRPLQGLDLLNTDAISGDASSAQDASRPADNLNTQATSHDLQEQNTMLDRSWQPRRGSNEKGLRDFFTSLRLPYSYQSLFERWHWLSRPILNSSIRNYPISHMTMPMGNRAAFSHLRNNPTLEALVQVQEDAFQEILNAVLNCDTSPQVLRPIDYFTFHAILQSALHTELLSREQKVGVNELKFIRIPTLRGIVADFDSDRSACFGKQSPQHNSLFRRLWGEAVDWPSETLWLHCRTIAEAVNFALPTPSPWTDREPAQSEGDPAISRISLGMPAFPQPTTMYASGAGSGGHPYSGIPQHALARSSPMAPGLGPNEAYGNQLPFSWPGANNGPAPLDMSPPFGVDMGAQLHAQQSPPFSMHSSGSSVSPINLRYMAAEPGLPPFMPGPRRRGSSMSEHSLHPDMFVPYFLPPATQRVLSNANRRIVQNREKSKRHYNRKKVQRHSLNEALNVCGQVFYMLRQVAMPGTPSRAPGPTFGQEGSPPRTERSLAQTECAIGITHCFDTQVTPPPEISPLLERAEQSIRRASAGQQGKDEHATTDLSSTTAQAQAADIMHARDASQSSGDAPTAANPPPFDLSDIIPNIMASTTIPSISSLSINERKKLSKMMQRHLEVSRMHQVSAVARHLCTWARSTGANRFRPEPDVDAIFEELQINRPGPPRNKPPEKFDAKPVSGGLRMLALRTVVTVLSQDPEAAATFAYVMAWRSFRTLWEDLIMAEARLMRGEQRPILELIALIDERQERSSSLIPSPSASGLPAAPASNAINVSGQASLNPANGLLSEVKEPLKTGLDAETKHRQLADEIALPPVLSQGYWPTASTSIAEGSSLEQA